DYQPQRGRFRDWLGLMTHRKLLNWRQKAGRQVAGTGGEEQAHALAEAIAPHVGDDWTAEFNRHVVQAAMRAVQPRFAEATWRAFELVWLHDLSAVDAARQLGLTVAAVYVAKSRVLRQLRDEVLVLADDIPSLVPLG